LELNCYVEQTRGFSTSKMSREGWAKTGEQRERERERERITRVPSWGESLRATLERKLKKKKKKKKSSLCLRMVQGGVVPVAEQRGRPTGPGLPDLCNVLASQFARECGVQELSPTLARRLRPAAAWRGRCRGYRWFRFRFLHPPSSPPPPGGRTGPRCSHVLAPTTRASIDSPCRRGPGAAVLASSSGLGLATRGFLGIVVRHYSCHAGVN
jgi:hypothetical protein